MENCAYLWKTSGYALGNVLESTTLEQLALHKMIGKIMTQNSKSKF